MKELKPLEAWIDSMASKLSELSSCRDEKGWKIQAIDKKKARGFIVKFIAEFEQHIANLNKGL